MPSNNSMTLEFPWSIKVDGVYFGTFAIDFDLVRQKWIGAWSHVTATNSTVNTVEGDSAKDVFNRLMSTATMAQAFCAGRELMRFSPRDNDWRSDGLELFDDSGRLVATCVSNEVAAQIAELMNES